MARSYSRLESMQDGDAAFLRPSPTPGWDPGRLQRCWDLGKDPRIARVARGGQASLPSSREQALFAPTRTRVSNTHAEGRLSARPPCEQG